MYDGNYFIYKWYLNEWLGFFHFRGAEPGRSRAAVSLLTILLLKENKGETKGGRKGDITDRLCQQFSQIISG